MRALVTGGAEFIGSALVRALADDGIPVAVLDSLTYAGNRANLSGVPGMDGDLFFEADIREADRVRESLTAFRPTVVFHLAAETHVDRSIDGPAACFEANIRGTYCLLSEVTAYWKGLDATAAESFRYLQVSTDEVFGDAPEGTAFVETSRYAPNSPYAASKASADYLVRTWSMALGLPTLIAHGANTYGPRQFPEKLIPLMTLNARDGRDLPVYGDGAQVRDWIYVDDHAAGLRAVAERGEVGQSYIVSARNPRTNLEIVTRICARLDQRFPQAASHDRLISHVADRPGHDRRYVSDPARIEGELGWQVRTGFEDGIAATVDWYLDNESWCETASARYDRQRLGLGAAAQ